MPVPTDPYTFANGPGNTADALQVNARFDPLYAALNGALDETNLSDALKELLGVSDASLKRRGSSIIATSEVASSTIAAALATPDRVEDVRVEDGGLLYVDFNALVKTNGATGRAGLYLNGIALPTVRPVTQSRAAISSTFFRALGTDPSSTTLWVLDAETEVADTTLTTGQVWPGGPLRVDGLVAGIYDVEVRWWHDSPAGTVTAKERRLRVWTQDF